ncbi:polysaccharide biosynthesis/export family protein [Aureimonas phyllosphaerae]|uniref:Polysaccharide export outer membrane protein n=1 Tax=Aureimonas phyllosphaerae TaxID=1166078 RepID=A0A7W6BR13_9HYPH|nr:polysaccharide biosynthesis/export family protein [Aureimonas phyllosphaerae]MBB3936488.1 polysaccharide export outer membrane protein [Aureimonas phyllosphaerae]MBB3960648.1 polysaccharide export outer membrane protein [Aureimonas phyllosphaerae]SFF29577.1 protein involved in polysaccharide export, contains SLBB domain of the beta-grasp fold [Aureimonas phyllosphaerae]
MPWIACRPSTLGAALLAGLLACAPVSAGEPYRLQVGDMVDFAILGTLPVTRKIMIDQDGTISIPLGGRFPAAGLTIEALRESVSQRLKTVSYPAGVDVQGAAVWSVIYPEGVLLDVGEFRPVYVSGDVLTPSAQPFRAGLTVAQVVAVVGGPSVSRSRQDHSLDRAGLGEEETAAFSALFQARLKVARLEAELAGPGEADLAAVAADGVEPALAERLRTLVGEQLAARRDDREKSRRNIVTSIEGSTARLGFLRQTQRNLADETRNYDDEIKRVEDLLQKGLTPIDRLRAAQRGALLVSTRSLDTLSAISVVERDVTDLQRELAKLDDTARMENLAALQIASAEANHASAHVEGLRQKARIVSGVGDEPEAIRYFITRSGGASARQEVEATAVLQPGDLVEVVLVEPPRGSLPEADSVAQVGPVLPTVAAPDMALAAADAAAADRVPTPTPALH